MLTLIHQTVGTLVVLTNIVAALWLWLLDRWQQPLRAGPRWSLWSARLVLALQVVLGLALIGGGAVGRTSHYVFAFVAVGVSWYTATSSRHSPRPLRTLALGCAAVGACALGAYVLGRTWT